MSGEDKQSASARAKRRPSKKLCGAQRANQPKGVTCARPAGWGTSHPGVGRCKRHGGATRNQTVAAQRQQAEQAVVSYGLPREVDPHTALLEELWRTAGHVAWLGHRVAELEREDMYGPVGGSEWGEPSVEPHVWIRLYQAERSHLARVAKTCVQVGIEERRVKLAEDQGRLIADFATGLMRELGIDPRSEKARVAVRKHLTLIAGGAG